MKYQVPNAPSSGQCYWRSRRAAIRPEVVIYDVDLSLTLPPAMTATSALNAIAHGVEALYATDGNRVLDVMSLDAMRAFRDGPLVLADPADRVARAKVLCGAWACSTPLGYGSMALHHKLCHVLGGRLGHRMPKRMRFCCRMRRGSMPSPCPRNWRGWRRFLGRLGRDYGPLPRGWVRHWRCVNWG